MNKFYFLNLIIKFLIFVAPLQSQSNILLISETAIPYSQESPNNQMQYMTDNVYIKEKHLIGEKSPKLFDRELQEKVFNEIAINQFFHQVFRQQIEILLYHPDSNIPVLAGLLEENHPDILSRHLDLQNHLMKLQDEKDKDKILQFINENALTHEEILLFLTPLIAEYSNPNAIEPPLPTKDMIEIIEKSKLDPNTQIREIENALFSIQDPNDPQETFYNTKGIKNLLKERINQYKVNFKDSKETIHSLEAISLKILNSDFIVTTLAHEILASKNLELIKYFYSIKQLDPNVSNFILETPIEKILRQSIALKTLNKDVLDVLTTIHKANKKINWNYQNIYKNTLMHSVLNFHAFFKDNDDENLLTSKIIPLLANKIKIDLTLKNSLNETAPLLAAKLNFPKLSEMLFKKGGASSLKESSIMNSFVTKKFKIVNLELIKGLEESLRVLYDMETFKEKKLTHNFEVKDPSLEEQEQMDKKTKIHQDNLDRISKVYLHLLNLKSNFYEKRLNHFTYLKIHKDITKLILKDDIEGFKKLYQNHKEIIDHPISSTHFGFHYPEKNILIHIDNILLEAIRRQSVKITTFLLDNIDNPEIFKPQKSIKNLSFITYLTQAVLPEFEVPNKKAPTIQDIKKEEKDISNRDETKSSEIIAYLDPISEALLQLSLTEEKNLRVNDKIKHYKARKILALLLNNKKITPDIKNYLKLTPMEIAILLNLEEVVLKFNKEYLIPIPSTTILDTTVFYRDFIKSNNSSFYKQLAKENILPKRILCRDVFSKKGSHEIH